MAGDSTPTPEDIEAQVAEDLINGVEEFTDGTNRVRMFSPGERLAAAQALRKGGASLNPLNNTTILNGPAGNFGGSSYPNGRNFRRV